MRALLILLMLATAASAGKARTNSQWGGSDLPFSCDLVRSYRAEIAAMSPETREAWKRRLHVTRKMQRQAKACLR